MTQLQPLADAEGCRGFTDLHGANTMRTCRHDWRFARTWPRHHKRTGRLIGHAVEQTCAKCFKRRVVDANTGRIIRR